MSFKMNNLFYTKISKECKKIRHELREGIFKTELIKDQYPDTERTLIEWLKNKRPSCFLTVSQDINLKKNSKTFRHFIKQGNTNSKKSSIAAIEV